MREEVIYLDDDNNTVDADHATHGEVLVYDDQGEVVQRVYFKAN